VLPDVLTPVYKFKCSFYQTPIPDVLTPVYKFECCFFQTPSPDVSTPVYKKKQHLNLYTGVKTSGLGV
jgi:hypothetical protein